MAIDELIEPGGSLADVTVGTWHNGALVRAEPIANMRHSPEALISFHSEMMPLLPGDLISTGTPGAAVIAAGDEMECRIDGLTPLHLCVVDARAL